MRTLKENFFGNLGIGKVAKIEEWLKKYKITNYTINSDFTIDVNSKVDLSRYPDKEFPEYIKFNIIRGVFNVSNSNLTSLKGCPNKCNIFYCNHCNNLTSLEGAPNRCRSFYCNHCNNLTSLEGAPKECIIFSCHDCKCDFSKEDVKKVCNAKNIWCD